MSTVSDLVDYYTNLLIIQYHDLPIAQGTIRAIVTQLLANGIMFDVRDGYSIDTAVGAQLDIIGKYVNLDRFYTGQNLSGYFSMVSDGEAVPADVVGFTSDTNPLVGKWLTYDDVLGIGLVLDDDNFRKLIKLRIVQNNSDHSHKSIDDGIYKFFGDTVRPDTPGNMVMYYFISSTLTELVTAAIQKKVLPRPMGVRLNGFIIQDDEPYFAFAADNGDATTDPYIAGFATYANFDIVPGSTLTYNDVISGA